MKKSTIIVGLILLVLAAFYFFPQLLGQGGDAPILGVVPANTMDIPTDITCSTATDCTDYAQAQTPGADVQARCDANLCVFITEKYPVEGTQ